ncbi:MAG: ATP-binding cassette domain-containing protein [Hyphomicrobiales bacterium]|nr:ATP-binding cassette domain-containing protein [Hyphomicrobiales bacterium]
MLRLDGVRVRFNDHLVLRGVTMSVAPARTTVLIGRNGAGKTTTLRSIMGLFPLDGGRVLLGDLDLATIPSHQRARQGIGYAPEDRRLIAEFSVEDNVLLPAVALRLRAAERKQRLEEVYALLPEVATFRKRPGGVLSGGQGKMVALGRALMVSTQYLLLDEPFQGLAPALALSYADTLARLRRTRPALGMLITESTPRLLDKIVDVSLSIERGEVI